MAERTLAYFMRETAKKQEIVEVPGIESIKDENGQVVPFKIKMLTKKEIDDIYDKYRTRTMLCDKKASQSLTGDRQYLISIQTATAHSGALWWRHWFIQTCIIKILWNFLTVMIFRRCRSKYFRIPRNMTKLPTSYFQRLGFLKRRTKIASLRYRKQKTDTL